MKRFLLVLAAGASGCLLFACDKSDKSDKDTGKTSGAATSGGAKSDANAAIEAFKSDVKGIKEWTEKNQPDASNPASGVAMMTEMVTKMKAVRTQGLPADLNAAFQKMLAVMDKMQAAMKDLPTDPTTATPDAAAKFQSKMEAISKEGDAAGEELKAAGKKYGLEDLELGK